MDLTFGLFVMFSVEDVHSGKCSLRCFPIADVLFFNWQCFSFHCAGESFLSGTDVQMTAIYFMHANSCDFISMLAAVVL